MNADDKAAINACIRKLLKLSGGEVRDEWIDHFVGVLIVLRDDPPERGRPGRPRIRGANFYRGIIEKTEEAKKTLRAAGKRATGKAAIEHLIRKWLVEDGVIVRESEVRRQVKRYEKRLSDARKQILKPATK